MSILSNIFGGGINHQDKKTGDTRLHVAARLGNTSEVKRLLKKGANPNIRNNRGMTALHYAAYWGEPQIVRALIKAGSKVNLDNGRGWTPLHSAALAGGRSGRQKTIEALVEAGARDDIQDRYGWTARQYMQVWEEDSRYAAELKKALVDDEIKAMIEQNDNLKFNKRNIPRSPRHGGGV